MTLNPHRPGHDYVRGIIDCCHVAGLEKRVMLDHFRTFHFERAELLDHDPIQKSRALSIVTEIDKIMLDAGDDWTDGA